MTNGVPNILEEMNAIQLRKNVNSKTVAIVVFGACENHGDHMPFGSDFFVPMELARRVASHARNVLVLPAFPYGVSLFLSFLFLFLIPGSAFAYWVPDYYGQGIGLGQGLQGPQGGYPGDNLGGLPGLPWPGNILSGIFGNSGNPYASVYGGRKNYF
jgi:Creatinine amidohydrolase